MSTYEVEVFNNTLKLTRRWNIQGKWKDAQTLLGGLHAVTKYIDTDSQATVWLQMARVLSDEALFSGIDNQEKRQEALNNVQSLAEASENKALVASIYDAIGLSQHVDFLNSDRSKEPEDELDFFERGLRLRKEHGTPGQVAESTFHVGLVYDVIRKQYDKALPYHKEAYKIATDEKDKLTASYAIRHIGFARYNADNVESAKQAFTESLELREAIGFAPGIAFSLVTLAQVDVEEGDKPSALARLKKARKLLSELDASSRVTWLDEQIAIITGSKN
jgi:tetratricopeptide (TPR) repeat protein